MNNVIKTDFHTFNTPLPLKPLTCLCSCETGATNGFASIFFWASTPGSHRASVPKPGPFRSLHSPFPLVFFHLHLKAAKYIQSGLAPAVVRHSLSSRSNRTAEMLPLGLQFQAMTPMCMHAPPPPPSRSQRRSDLAAGYLANHTKLILVPLKPGDYGGISSLFVCLNA